MLARMFDSHMMTELLLIEAVHTASAWSVVSCTTGFLRRRPALNVVLNRDCEDERCQFTFS
jgi:hypothetical protein